MNLHKHKNRLWEFGESDVYVIRNQFQLQLVWVRSKLGRIGTVYHTGPYYLPAYQILGSVSGSQNRNWTIYLSGIFAMYRD